LSVIFTVLVIIFVIFYSFYRLKLREVNRRYKLHENLTRLKQEALAQQMNPHFIFNTLSSIQYYINENDKKASNKYLTMFSQLMRMTLDNSYQKTISIAEEVKTLNFYIKLEQLRFEGKFEYEIRICDEFDPSKYQIPSLLLQPFVENSIWHGLMHKETKDGKLDICINKYKNEIQCKISDNGVGRFKAEQINTKRNKTHNSLGSKITESRLKLINSLYGNDLSIIYNDLVDSSGNAEGTEVIIRLPLIEHDYYKS